MFTMVIVQREQKMNINCIKSTKAISTTIYYTFLSASESVGEKYYERFCFVLVKRGDKGDLNDSFCLILTSI